MDSKKRPKVPESTPLLITETPVPLDIPFKMLNDEKFHLNSVLGFIVSNDPLMVNMAIVNISRVAQNVTQTGRISDQIAVSSVDVQGTVLFTEFKSSTATMEAFRCPLLTLFLVLDTQWNNATTMATENIFSNSSGSIKTAVMPFRVEEFRSRYKVLATRVITPKTWILNSWSLDEEGVSVDYTGTPGERVPFQMHHDFKEKLKVNFSGVTATSSEVIDNMVALVGVCTRNGTSITVKLSCLSKMKFIDSEVYRT